MFMTGEVEDEPTAAYLVSLIGGVIGLIASFAFIGIAAWVASLSSGPFVTYTGPPAALFGFLAVWGLISSAVVIISALELRSDPWEHTKWGIVILVFSIIGVSSIVGLIGGVLALVYEPREPVAYKPPAQVITRICPKCGRVLSDGVKFCPYCGNQLAQ
jgi:hypothetical protein